MALICMAALGVALLFLRGILDDQLTEDMTAVMGAPTGMVILLCSTFFKSQRSNSTMNSSRLLPSPHLALMIPFSIWYLLYCPRWPPPAAYALYPTGIAFGAFLCQFFMALRRFPMTTRCGIFTILSLLHCFRPLLSIGWREPALVIVGGVTGLLCGAALSAGGEVVSDLMDLAEYNRRADFKLNHVIKGQCGGAAALLSALIEAQSEHPDDGMILKADLKEELLQIRDMIRHATDWCDSPAHYRSANCADRQTTLLLKPQPFLVSLGTLASRPLAMPLSQVPEASDPCSAGGWHVPNE